MKKTLTLLLGVLLISELLANVNFSIDYANFQSDNKPYTEFYLSINGSSFGYAMVKQEGEVELFQ